MRNWALLIVAAVFEVCWVIGLNQASTVLEWGGTGVAIVVSFILLLQATKQLPVATAYAVFVGLGTVGSVAVDTLVLGQALPAAKLVFIITLLIGVVGLKMVTKESDTEGVS
ncbi:DMT family transporter [Alkalicoccobacillus murimartini]|uniref:Paired small multidrug resistance pump n=1 Tax=Alkalicoccobacillus murimartini TaxID=171685 RepID=A0ABT9YGN6_9BACI|nr:SMR family transporter [Alkalicoccobacillus murimartini]MDQ0207022.1 paired small multidrug resistance pump [Alkalicoccobacillus murimartini]